MKPKSFMVIAGEASGDVLAAELVGAFHRRTDADRNDVFHRQQWGVIRRAAKGRRGRDQQTSRKPEALRPSLQFKLS